jgi:processive 1,2-diacylglycerol beta-glucosyltransferase
MRLLLLSSSTGGGHDMRARSFAQWAEEPPRSSGDTGTPVVQAIRRQCLEDDGPLYAFGAWLYNFIQRTLPALHHIYFNVLEVVPFCGSVKALPGRAAFQEAVRAAQPDVVLSTHDHLNHAFLDAARAALPERPPLCGTYCGELSGGYGFSRRWVNPGADFFIGAVDACTAQARRLGMSPKKSWTGGFMLNPDFWSPPQTDSERAAFLRDELRLEPGRFTLLLGTGANGANNHIALLAALARARVHPQVIALCGNNAAAKSRVEAWAAAHPQIPVCALGYQSRMKRVLECSDAVFARPGTGTTSEAIQSGLPVLFNGIGGVMPQEIITVRYCRKFFEAHVASRARALPALVDAWMRDEPRLARVRAGVCAARPEGHPLRILESLALWHCRKHT